MRVLALDIGSKRIGVAVSDELGFTAQALKTLESRGHINDIKSVVELVKNLSVTEIVVGMPYNMDGSEGPQAKKALELMDELAQATSVPVFSWDERMTTMAAERMLIEADLSRAKRRKVVDRVAATLILQGYLDSKRV